MLRWGWERSPLLGMAPSLLAVTVLGRAAQSVGQTTYPIDGRQLLSVGNGEIGTMTALGGLVGVLVAASLGARATPSNALAMLAAGQAVVLGAFIALALPGGGVAALWTGAVLVWAGSGLVFPATMTAVGTGGGTNPSRSLAVYAVGLSVGLMIGPVVESGVLRLLSESLPATFAALVPLPAAATVLSVIGAAAHARRNRTASRAAGAGDTAGAVLEARDRERVEQAVTSAVGVGEPTLPPGHPDTPDTPGGPGAPGRARRAGSLLRLPPYRLALATLLTYQAPYSALVAFGGLVATRADGASTAAAELGFAAFYAVSFLVRAVVVRLSPVRHLRTALVASVLATGAGLAIVGTAHQFALLVVGMGILGAPHGLTFPVASSVIAEHVDHDRLGRANARVMASTNATSVVVPLACGWLAAVVGYRSTFLFVEVPVVVFGAMLIFELTNVSTCARDHTRPAS